LVLDHPVGASGARGGGTGRILLALDLVFVVVPVVVVVMVFANRRAAEFVLLASPVISDPTVLICFGEIVVVVASNQRQRCHEGRCQDAAARA